MNLAALTAGKADDALKGCTFFDAGLLYYSNQLYLAVQCSRYTASGEDTANEFVALFSTQPDGSPKSWTWTYRGKLATHADAVALGGQNLLQTDLALGQDGTLMATFSPSAPASAGRTLAQHFGCRVVEIASLSPPTLARDSSGALRVRATVTASDLVAPDGSPASCGYDASSSTGIVIARRDDRGGLRSALYRTALRP
jgi:hypothetical protein